MKLPHAPLQLGETDEHRNCFACETSVFTAGARLNHELAPLSGEKGSNQAWRASLAADSH